MGDTKVGRAGRASAGAKLLGQRRRRRVPGLHDQQQPVVPLCAPTLQSARAAAHGHPRNQGTLFCMCR